MTTAHQIFVQALEILCYRYTFNNKFSQTLPYLLLTNEDIKRVLDLYMYAFSDMLHQPKIQK